MKKTIFVILLMILSISMVDVEAESIASGYSLLIRKGEITESFSTSEVTSETKNILNNSVSFNNSFFNINNLNADRLSITDSSASLSGPLSVTITGNNTLNILTLTSCSLSISGTGTLKFIPSFFGEEGIIKDVEEQKQFVNSRIKTNLAITYEDGYVFINKSVPVSDNKETVENNTVDTNNNVTVPNDSEKNDHQDVIITDDGDIDNNTDSNTDTSETVKTEDKEQDINGEKEEKQTNDDSNNLLLYIGVGIGSVATVGLGTLIFRKIKH